MEQVGEETRKSGNDHIFWGIIFILMGVLALYRGLMVVAGIPLWALSFMAIGVSNLLRAPRVLTLLRLNGKWAKPAAIAAFALNIAGIASIIVSLAAGFIFS